MPGAAVLVLKDGAVVLAEGFGLLVLDGLIAFDVAVGDHVVVHPGQWDRDDPWVAAGKDPGLAGSFRVWGYDSCWGSMAQFTKVQAQQLLRKPAHLAWEEAASYGLTYFTAYRMLIDRAGRIKPCGGAIPPRLIRDFGIPDELLVAHARAAARTEPTASCMMKHSSSLTTP